MKVVDLCFVRDEVVDETEMAHDFLDRTLWFRIIERPNPPFLKLEVGEAMPKNGGCFVYENHHTLLVEDEPLTVPSELLCEVLSGPYWYSIQAGADDTIIVQRAQVGP